MTALALQPSASGTGTVTLTAPNTNSTRTLTLPDTTGTILENTNPVVAQINGGQLAGFRNKIINGKMEIAQRGTSFAAIAAGAYSLDRWANTYVSTAVVTASQQVDVPSGNEFQNSLRFAVTTADTSIAATDLFAVRYRIEGYNVRDLIGKTFTLSFWVRSSKTGVHCVPFRNTGTDRSYVTEYTILSANTWEYKTISVSGGLITAGTWNWTNGMGLEIDFVMACGTTFQTTANAWQTGDFFATSNQVNCLDTVGNTFAITGVQLEAGSVATPFEHRLYGAELALCQRYFTNWIGDSSGTGYRAIGNGYVTGTVTDLTTLIPLSVAMRITPALSFSGTITVVAGNQTGTVTSIPNSYASSNSTMWCIVRTNGTLTTGQGGILYTQNAATNIFNASAEL